MSSSSSSSFFLATKGTKQNKSYCCGDGGDACVSVVRQSDIKYLVEMAGMSMGRWAEGRPPFLQLPEDFCPTLPVPAPPTQP